MRAIFKTDYDQDIRLFKHSGYAWSYGALLMIVLLAPLMVGSYLQSQLVFVFIYAIVGVGLLILTGFTGQVSLGHAAFLAIGAYTAAYLQRLGVPFLVYLPLSGLIAGAVGALVGFPALRLSQHRQISEQRPGFPRLRQRYRGAVAADREIAEHFDFKCQA